MKRDDYLKVLLGGAIGLATLPKAASAAGGWIRQSDTTMIHVDDLLDTSTGDGLYLKQDGSTPLTAAWDAGSFKITAETFESDIATGTAPFTVASTTLVSNLNSDLLDGQEGNYYLNSANFTGTDWNDLTDGGDTTLHSHDADYLEIAYRDFWNGSFRETFDALVTSDGATVTMSLEQSGGGDLTMQFSDGSTTLDCTPACTIALTAGSDTSPQSNYIYIPQSTKVLTKSTTGFPTSAEHIKVGYFFVPSAGHVQTEGVYINQNWNDHLEGTDSQGHMLHMAERMRRDGAYYFSGIDANGSDQSAASSYFDYVGASESYFKSTSGVIYQMHRHTVPAFDSSVAGDDIHVINWSGDNYHELSNLADIVADSTGTTLSNKYFNLFFFAVGNKTGEYSPVMCMLPSGSYVSQTSAENDVDGYDNLTMPRQFNLESSTGIPICRMTLRWTGGTTTLTHISTVDLRSDGLTAGGGGTGSTTNFADNQFTVFNNADNTKIIDLDASAITTGNTRTLTMADVDIDLGSDFVRVDGTLPLTANWDAGAFTIQSDGFILSNNQTLAWGSATLKYDGTDFDFNETVKVTSGGYDVSLADAGSEIAGVATNDASSGNTVKLLDGGAQAGIYIDTTGAGIPLYILEQPDPTLNASAGVGRIWVKDDTPNTLYFTSDDGTDWLLNKTWAQTALDNLSSVAINTSLLSDTDNTDDLGSSTKRWKDIWYAGGLYGRIANSTKTGDYTVTLADSGVTFIYTGASDGTFTLPSVTASEIGVYYTFINTTSNSLKINAADSDTIMDSDSGIDWEMINTGGDYGVVTLMLMSATQWYIVAGTGRWSSTQA